MRIEYIRQQAEQEAREVFPKIDLEQNKTFEAIEDQATELQSEANTVFLNATELGYYWEEYYFTINLLAEEKGITE